MAITVEESPMGRKTGLKKAERQYKIRGTSDEGDALGALLGGAAPSVNGMILNPSECDVEELTPNAEDANHYYVGTAAYSAPGDPSSQQAGSFSISFDISGQTVHYNQALVHVADYIPDSADDSTTRDFKGAINVDEGGAVNGVDIIVPCVTISVNCTFAVADVNDAYIATVSRLVGSVNSTAYKEFAEGELLLTRVSGQRRDKDSWDMSFGFSVSENKTGFALADISGIDKKGWEYLWVYYVTDDNGTVIIKKPVQVCVEKVYPEKDFAALAMPSS